MQQLSHLEYIKDPKDVWPSEAHDFTPWLLNNAVRLSEVLGIDLELTENEYPVGDFALDLIGRDLTNDCPLIVENQLTVTDHTHLGKVVTYSAGTDARTIVWMATRFREEHRQALDWLNQVAEGNARFFGVEIQAVRIADSPPAPLFQLRAQPNDWASLVSSTTRASVVSSGKGGFYIQFWSSFIERVREEHPDWTNARKPSSANWLSMPCPFKGGPYYSASFAAGGKLRSELYIDYPQPDDVESLYGFLAEHQDHIETSYGSSLSWEPLTGRRASRIAEYRSGDVANVSEHDEYIDWFFVSGAKFRAAIAPLAKEWADLAG